jgi:hypothetical protein
MKTDIAYIYALIDPIDTSVRYIGKTVTPNKRLSEHISECKNVRHRRANWINSLLIKNIKPEMIILKICPLSEFEKYESEFIKFYKSNNLTNSDENGQGNKNRKRDIIDRIAKKLSKKVYRFDLGGNFIDEYVSVRDAGRKLNINHSHIVRCCNGVIKHTNKFIFKYDRNSSFDKVSIPNAVKKEIVEIDLNLNIIGKWKSLMDCSRETGIDNGNLSRVCNGKKSHIKGRYFTFV